VRSHHQDFGKIKVSAANADKRHFARLLDQKPLHLSKWIDLSRPCAAQAIEDPDVVREAGRDGRADEA
jgi:hypothetical protein